MASLFLSKAAARSNDALDAADEEESQGSVAEGADLVLEGLAERLIPCCSAAYLASRSIEVTLSSSGWSRGIPVI